MLTKQARIQEIELSDLTRKVEKLMGQLRVCVAHLQPSARSKQAKWFGTLEKDAHIVHASRDKAEAIVEDNVTVHVHE